ncbi:MAG TPA: four helix bundle protein [Haliangiales bacterium]|nr:four helix bundle protein [Haliangiales bacterium]
MTWHVFEVSLQLIRCLRGVVAELARHDGDLTAQIRRAASSVPANLGEGLRRAGRDRRYHFRVAAGSAEEVRAALRTAGAWGYVDDAALAEPRALLDRLGAMLYRMTH